MNFLTNINLSQNQIQNAVLHPLTNAPAGVEGQVYYNSVSKHLYLHNGTDWAEVGSTYTLPIASDTVLGGVKVGSGLAIDGAGVLSTVLQTVKVNGSSLVISSNAVDILIAVGTSNGQIKVNGSDITIYTHPTYTASDTSNSVTPDYAGTFTVVDDVTRINGHVTAINTKTVTMPTAYVHPNHTGDVTSTGDGATVIGANKVTLAKIAQITTASFLGRNTASTGNVEVLSTATVKTMLGLALTQTALATGFSIAGGTTSKTLTVSNTLTLAGTDGSTLNIGAGGTLNTGAFAAAYVHPTGDGNLHIPANGTTNNGKILTANGTAGSYSWQTNAPLWANIQNKPTSTVANIDNAVSLRHTQNTDTGTTSSSFLLDNDGATNGVLLKASVGELQLRTNTDGGYANLRVQNLYVEGTQTIINSNEVDIGDSNILLNAEITTSAQNSNGGISIKRLMANNTTRKDAVLEYNISTDKWQTTFGDVANTLTTLPLANKYATTLGNAVDTSFTVTHNLNTRDVVVTIHETGDDYEVVYTDVKVTTANTVTVLFATAPTAAQYTITIVG